jgi:hypothetical protein
MSENIMKRTREQEQVAESLAPPLPHQQSDPGLLPTGTYIARAAALDLQRPTVPVETSTSYVKPLLAELIGTFTFVFLGAGSIITNSRFGWLSLSSGRYKPLRDLLLSWQPKSQQVCYHHSINPW